MIMSRILIIDDDTYICKLLDNFLNKKGYQTETAHTGSSALKLLKESDFHLVLCDYRLPDLSGFDILAEVKSMNTRLPVIIMTAYKELGTAVKLIKAGAYDYITKPLLPEEVAHLIQEAISKIEGKEDATSFESEFIEGFSANYQRVVEYIKIVSPVNMTVVIEGETGSGKEIVARAIHYNSQRKKGPFISVDCGALPDGVVNSELFGHVKGSFTGATFDKKGYFEQASGGTLFLDEITNLNSDNQMKLLRVLQEKILTRIGDTRKIKVDVRLIVASNVNLLMDMEQGNLREDLYHRLNEFKIVIPPLRDRGDDILIFVDEFISRAARRFQKHVIGYTDEVRDLFKRYDWPGNIRELKNIVTRAVLLSTSKYIDLDVIPEEVKTRQAIQQHTNGDASSMVFDERLKDTAEKAEKEAIIQALVKSNYNKSQAARLLHIDRKTLYNKINQFDIALNKS